MKRKIAIVLTAALFVLALAQYGFAANNGVDRDSGTDKICCNCWVSLSPEEQEQAKADFEEYRAKKETLREEFKTKQSALREQYLNKLPEAVRAKIEEKKNTRERRHQGEMRCEMRRPHCHGGRLEFEKKE